jgi:hypothetical protein
MIVERAVSTTIGIREVAPEPDAVAARGLRRVVMSWIFRRSWP